MKKIAIILGGGSGVRAGGDIPKQFQLIGGKPMLWWSIEAFHKEDSSTVIYVMLHPNFFDLWDEFISGLPEDEYIEHIALCGGRSRWHSVYNGLLEVASNEDLYVAVHDGARPLVSIDMISRGWEAASKHKAAIPIIPLTDSIRKLTSETESHVEDRTKYVAVQTPQIFRSDLLKKAYTMPDDPRFTDPTGKSGIPPFTDDASVVEAFGEKVSLYAGDTNNIKVTNPADFAIANLLIAKR